MTTDDIKTRLLVIKSIYEQTGDNGAAHWLEDQLYEQFVMWVGERSDEVGEMARLVLTSKDIRFGRYF